MVCAVVGAIVVGCASTADASDEPSNRGWETQSNDTQGKNRGWDNDERAGLTPTER